MLDIRQSNSPIVALRARLQAAATVEEMDLVAAAVGAIEAAEGPSVASRELVGLVLKKKSEWEAAAIHFGAAVSQFPEALELVYQAALSSVDAGAIVRAQNYFFILHNRLDRLTDQQLRGCWRAAPGVGLHDLAADAFDTAARRGSELCTELTRVRLETALETSRSALVAKVACVSIGENCLPWQIGNRWGFRTKDGAVAQDSPFNLAQTSTQGVADLLRAGLDPLMASERLVYRPSNAGRPMPLNPAFRFCFNHEIGDFFVERDYAELKRRYLPKIEKLAAHLRDRPAVFVHYVETRSALAPLVEAFEGAVGHPHRRLVIVDVGGGDGLAGGEGVHYLRLELPRPDYVWWQPAHWDSVEGDAFERQIAGEIERAMTAVAAGL